MTTYLEPSRESCALSRLGDDADAHFEGVAIEGVGASLHLAAAALFRCRHRSRRGRRSGRRSGSRSGSRSGLCSHVLRLKDGPSNLFDVHVGFDECVGVGAEGTLPK